MEIKKEYMQWMSGRDTGISSETIMSAILGIDYNRPDVPYDAADFGRCARMLEQFPELRKELKLVSDKHKIWIPFIDCWKQLERDYKECKKWWALPEAEQKKLKRRKHFYNPAELFYNKLKTLVDVGRYLNGMRYQNSMNSMSNKAPETV